MKARNWMRFVVTVIAVLSIIEVCFASYDGDFHWSTTELSFDVERDWEDTFGEEFRLGVDSGHLYRHHSYVRFVYKSQVDWIDLSLNYRQVFEKDSEGKWRQENQPHLNLILKGRLFNLNISDRARLEYCNRKNTKDIWKLTMKLPLEPTELELKPYVANEISIPMRIISIEIGFISD